MPRRPVQKEEIEIEEASETKANYNSSYDGAMVVGIMLGIILSYMNLVQLVVGLLLGYGLAKHNIDVDMTFITRWFIPMSTRLQSMMKANDLKKKS